jgi:hypothetical protein
VPASRPRLAGRRFKNQSEPHGGGTDVSRIPTLRFTPGLRSADSHFGFVATVAIFRRQYEYTALDWNWRPAVEPLVTVITPFLLSGRFVASYS